MDIKRRQQIAGQGHALAEWLNDPKWEKNEVRCRIAIMVAIEELVRDKTAVEAVLRSQGITDEDMEEFAHNEAADEPVDCIAWMNVRMRVRFVRQGQGIGFELEPYDEESRHLYAWAALYATGHALRLRKCPNCRRFWYCDGRTDKIACSKACKDTLWEKTPQGKATKAAYMRDLRANHKKLWEAKQRGRRLKRGRNVHVSLKKGE